MRAEAISGTNLFGYRDRKNNSSNDGSPSDTAEDTRKGREQPAAKNGVSTAGPIVSQTGRRPKIGGPTIRGETTNLAPGRSRNASKDKNLGNKSESESALKNAKAKKKIVETPAFGTQKRHFFKVTAARSRESSQDDLIIGGFT